MFDIGDTVWVVSQSFDQQWVSRLSKISNKIINDGVLFYLVSINSWGQFGEGLKLIESYTDKIFESKEECDKYISNRYYDNECRGCKYDEMDCNWTCNDCKMASFNVCRINQTNVSNREICKYYVPTLPQNIHNWSGADWYLDLQINCFYNKGCPLHKNSVHRTCTYKQWANHFTKVYYPKTYYNGREIASFYIKNIDWWNNRLFYLDREDDIIHKCVEVYGITYVPLKTPSGKDKKGTCNQGEFWEKCHTLTIGGDNNG